MRTSGRFEITSALGENVRAFVPFALPPKEPSLELVGDLMERIRRAEEALRMLNAAAAMVPDVGWFVYAFVRKEAVVSSQIEGTQAVHSEERRADLGAPV